MAARYNVAGCQLLFAQYTLTLAEVLAKRSTFTIQTNTERKYYAELQKPDILHTRHEANQPQQNKENIT